MIRALLFDCNGIIADDEPVHLKLFQKVLKEEGIKLTRAEYFRRYLALDDKTCFREVLTLHGRPHSQKDIQALIDRKAKYYKETIAQEIRIFPGLKDFVAHHRKRYGMGVVSGALRHEIEWILKHAGIASAFPVVVSSEDVNLGKPDPACYVMGYKKLAKMPQYKEKPLKPEECLAIEDSIHGVESAHAAGMKCMAVTNSYGEKALSHADVVVKTLEGVEVGGLRI